MCWTVVWQAAVVMSCLCRRPINQTTVQLGDKGNKPKCNWVEAEERFLWLRHPNNSDTLFPDARLACWMRVLDDYEILFKICRGRLSIENLQFACLYNQHMFILWSCKLSLIEKSSYLRSWHFCCNHSVSISYKTLQLIMMINCFSSTSDTLLLSHLICFILIKYN